MYKFICSLGVSGYLTSTGHSLKVNNDLHIHILNRANDYVSSLKNGWYFRFIFSNYDDEERNYWTSNFFHKDILHLTIFELHHLGYLHNLDNEIYYDYIKENIL